MKKAIRSFVAVAVFAVGTATAQVSGNAVVKCSGEHATLYVSAYTSTADAGRPGAWYVAAHHPTDLTRVAFLTPLGWREPDRGGFVPYSEHRAGIPASLEVRACLPQAVHDDYGYATVDLSSCSYTSQHLAGYIVKAGYGVLTPAGEKLVSSRRERMEVARPLFEERGKWRTEYDDDEHLRESLVLKSLREEHRVADFLVVPTVHCPEGFH